MSRSSAWEATGEGPVSTLSGEDISKHVLTMETTTPPHHPRTKGSILQPVTKQAGLSSLLRPADTFHL